MIIWLDGNDNRSGSPDENLAREFMELFALGIGNYTEDDVRAAARALTGWTVDRRTGKAKFVDSRHDGEPTRIFGQDGEFTAESFVDLVLGREESAPFVVGRLWYRLVSPDPPDDATRDGHRARVPCGHDRAGETTYGSRAGTVPAAERRWPAGRASTT